MPRVTKIYIKFRNESDCYKRFAKIHGPFKGENITSHRQRVIALCYHQMRPAKQNSNNSNKIHELTDTTDITSNEQMPNSYAHVVAIYNLPYIKGGAKEKCIRLKL